MKKMIFLVAAFALASSLAAYTPGNAYWKPDIKVLPAIPLAGQNVVFKAYLNIEKRDMQNLHFIVKVDEEVIYDNTLYFFMVGTDYLIQANWVAKGGAHRVVFTLVGWDNITPDENPNDNMVAKTFSVQQPPPISTGQPQGTPTLPGSPQNLQTHTELNLKFKPCVQFQNEPTDLVVHSLSVSPGSGTSWNYKATVQNLGRRCVKAVEYELKCLGLKLVAYYAGAPSDAVNFFLPEGQTRTIQGSFTPTANFPFFPKDGHKFTRFEFILDPNQKVPDPNRGNNSKTMELMLD